MKRGAAAGEALGPAQKRQSCEVRCSCEELRTLTVEILLAHGAHQDIARDAAEAICRSSLRGIDSHGIALLPRILERVAEPAGRRCQLSEPCVVQLEAPAVAVLDARLSPGQHACLVAARLAAEKAKQCGIALVLVKNSTHFGAAAAFLEELLNNRLVGAVGSNSTPSMAILNSKLPNIGNCPFGFCAPVADGPDFLFDFCCAVMSFG